MLGAVAGDILGAPYRKVDLSGEGFEFFAPTRTYSRDGVINHHPRPTDNSCLAVAVSSGRRGGGGRAAGRQGPGRAAGRAAATWLAHVRAYMGRS